MDGASYHSSRSARDRDRLRQQVLESRGWIIHRIWSTDWFHRPDEQLKKVLAAIERARAEWSRRDREGELTAHAAMIRPASTTIDRERPADDFESDGVAIATEPYREADLSVHTSQQIHELSVGNLAHVLVKIVEIEGPVHQNEIARRVAGLWGLKRTGNRIVDAVDAALAELVNQELLTNEGPFFWDPRQERPPIRSRENVQSSQLRRPDMLPPQEIRAALAAVVGTHLGIAREDAVVETARLFGYRSTSAQLREVIDRQIDPLAEAAAISLRNGKLYPATNRPDAVLR